MTNAATEITIFDPDGNEYVMQWASRFDADETWCDFCEEYVTGAWFNNDGAALFVLCEDCATSQQ
jgi:uncharacterized protein YrzB (UPF0473 family)